MQNLLLINARYHQFNVHYKDKNSINDTQLKEITLKKLDLIDKLMKDLDKKLKIFEKTSKEDYEDLMYNIKLILG